MIKIVLVAPYDEFADRFNAVAADILAREDNSAHEETELEVRICYDQDIMPNLHFDCDAIIARAHSAKLLTANANAVPVVRMIVQAVDVIRCIKKAWAQYGKRKIIFPGSYTMVNQAYQVPELIDVDLEILEMPSTMGDEVIRVFGQIHDREAIIIGGTPLCDMARDLGLRWAMVESGEEAMALALEEAKRTAIVARREAEKAQHIRTILDSFDEAIISVDKLGTISYFNYMAAQILQLRPENVLHHRIEDVTHDEQLLNFFRLHSDCKDEILRYTSPSGDKLGLSAGKSSIKLGGAAIGTVVRLQYISRLQDSEAKLRSKLSEKDHKAKHRFYEILGSAPSTTFAISQAQKYSQSEASVLITGKSGTGKELFAQSIHNASRRRSFPFVAINCAAIPEALLESELFGYVEGAFTGAVRGGKMGLIELAHRGTLFLDEISELPLSLQARLLRVLQEKEIRRLGHDKVINVDIRVISATNRNLREQVTRGEFREDLFYRLDVLRLELPSLSERREDIPTLCRHYISLYAGRNNMPTPEFNDDAMALLSSLPWNGNIRELGNVCQRLIVLGDGERISAQLVEDVIHRPARSFLSDERLVVQNLLNEGVTKAEIARKLDIDRTTLWRKMKKWELN